LRARADVVPVDLRDDVRAGDVELLEVLHDEHAALVEQRPHRPVEHEERPHRLPEGGVPARRAHELCYQSEMPQITFTQALAEAMAEEMRRDPRVIALATTRAPALEEEFGDKRVRVTPISE